MILPESPEPGAGARLRAEAIEQLTGSIEWWVERLATYNLIGQEAIIRPPRALATVTVDELMGEDHLLAGGAAQTVIEWCLMTGDEQASQGIPERWWRTPLGRLVARTWRYGIEDAADDAEASLSVPEAMALLGVARARINDLLNAGRLRSTDDGQILRASVGELLVERDFK